MQTSTFFGLVLYTKIGNKHCYVQYIFHIMLLLPHSSMYIALSSLPNYCSSALRSELLI